MPILLVRCKGFISKVMTGCPLSYSGCLPCGFSAERWCKERESPHCGWRYGKDLFIYLLLFMWLGFATVSRFVHKVICARCFFAAIASRLQVLRTRLHLDYETHHLLPFLQQRVIAHVCLPSTLTPPSFRLLPVWGWVWVRWMQGSNHYSIICITVSFLARVISFFSEVPPWLQVDVLCLPCSLRRHRHTSPRNK